VTGKGKGRHHVVQGVPLYADKV